MVYRFFRLICIILSKIFFRFEVFGRYRVPRRGAVILASNHTSFLDPVIIGAAVPRPLNFMARDDLFSNRSFGAFISALGAFPVKRDRSSPEAFREAFKRLRENKALVIFPEGTRTEDGSLRKAHAGVGFLAARSESTVVPVYIEGSKEALPRDAYFIRMKLVKIYFGKPLRYRNISRVENREEYQRFADLVMDSIANLRREAKGIN